MSTPYSRSQSDPLSLVAMNDDLLDSVAALGRSSPRHRFITRLHDLPELFQRMLNAIEPESYVRPHRHTVPPKNEVFIALRGSALVVRFAEDGTPIEGVLLEADGPARGVEIPAGAWHCLVSLESGTVLFEAKEGPYEPASDKDFAPWAPAEDDREAGLAYIAALRAQFATAFPVIAARNLVEAEDDEIL